MPLSGFNDNNLRKITQELNDQKALIKVYSETYSVIGKYTDELLTEITSSLQDYEYCFDMIEKRRNRAFFSLNIKVFQTVDDVNYDSRLTTIRTFIDRMVGYLYYLSKSSDVLKAVYLISYEGRNDFVSQATKYVTKSLNIFISICQKIHACQHKRESSRFSDYLLYDNAEDLIEEGASDELTRLLNEAKKQVSTSKTFDSTYPLGILPHHLRRPSLLEQYWGRYLLLGSAVSISAVLIGRMTWSGQLQVVIRILIDVARNFVREHMVEPLLKLAGELFDTLRRRDGIVSREDLEQSNRALTRMLEDYAASHKIDMKLEMQRGNGGGGEIREQAMELLMRRYESELRSPISGVLFGSLMTAMLIQMQKLKVHTEAAMLTMDQILTSNELTMAATAAMPAMAVL
eukprot:gene12326-25929_t